MDYEPPTKNVQLLHRRINALISKNIELIAERDKAREALSAIAMHLDPTEDSLQALIAAFVDEGLGEVA